MKQRLSVKFILLFLLFGLAVFVFIALAGEPLFRSASRRSAAQDLYRQVTAEAAQQSQYFSQNLKLNEDALRYTARTQGTRYLVLDIENTIVLDTDSRLTGSRLTDFDPAASSNYYRTGSFYGVLPDNTLSVFAPIHIGMDLLAYLTLHQDLAVADARANPLMLRIYLVAFAIYLLSLPILLCIHFWVLRPAGLIASGAREYAEGNLKHRIPVTSHDEMGYLAASLNDMAQQLQSADVAQKRFIANVSHDFRSPLTSIKGYLEAMVDGVIPPESQEKYLHIVIGETERLANLTQSMLSLNSLDEARLGLELSDFDMAVLVRSVCETFEGICSKRGITFELIFAAPSYTVRADYGRINQALHNLIDNAIKFSDEKSSIRIRLQDVGEKLSVSIKDFGCGIPKEDLGKIWTRFYKSDASRGKDKKGTGLGLSITREIIMAHGETIDVASTPGSGTEFIFRLPLVR